ncbi:AraC family transcriptional regulator [Flavobacterium arcticum]|uniref:AraC family transcriptional regulator n=1 Tax=Flavobacterium arcticum TaxID=1784713 RepID=A0A345HEK3_9FLAO|nr:helix-turn-helix domain-containing protein [Flavobacterium arcticum]AXG75013.1 AraC family transcriptional regulator [Flavobacterium arcticum]KAF2506566.1 AraC family transcriptional regulator [Flavobacterium arcticum]
MEYKTYMPCKELAKQVKLYWSLETKDNDASHERERIFPDGCIELIFNYGDRFKKYETNGEFHLQPYNFIHGQLKTYFELQATGKIGIFSARFHPAGLQPFINFNVDSFTDSTLTVSEVWEQGGEILAIEMLYCATHKERIKTLENFLINKKQILKIDNTPVEHCVNSILKTIGAITIESLSVELSISKRQLERRFIAAVGISPKLLARIVRFQHVLQLIESKTFKSFTTVAYEGGFYDQAHFIKDFKDFTGLNPKKYFSENLEMVKHFSFDE